MHKIVFLDRATIAPQIRLRRPGFAHELIEHGQTRPEQVVERLSDASIAIVNKVRLSAEVLERLPDLRLIAVAATGTDCVDKEYCRRRGIAVSNIRGYAVNTVPEHTFALILALRRSIVAYRQDVLAGEWQKAGQFCFFNHPIHDLQGARLGIIGEGVLGQRVAELARAFGMVPLFAAHKGRSGLGPPYTPWDEVLATSDVITLHSPLTPETRGMIGLSEFRRMAKRPLIVNTARGGLVVEEDLVTALDEGLISGAGFDVTEAEPPAPDSPLMRIAGRPNVIVTPHVAWASDEAQQALADQLIGNIENFVSGAPSNLVHGAY
ncbi:D-2-hydroxyacid dehydrogenase [Azospirillum sp. TSO22-1]|uniref:D-2-hydroxyacid dehydrogenase n=1 Tax=Azospirillum sp. TSO22-1 TaxID=716789 RepID=UPI000D6125C7|nr:D-2-hydroxyacid dehydrogenase [Azospirillum sp. TSO22-1]PWC41902.1 glycerate dehydrogenase [Azospirillum sp. TSO22-1]